MSTDTTNVTDPPLTSAQLDAIKARYDNATGGAWYFEEQYGPHFLASERHGYMHGIGDLIGFGDGEQADADREFVQNAKSDMALLLDEVDRLNGVMAAVAKVLKPCAVPNIAAGYDMCTCDGGQTWPCAGTRAAWAVRGLDVNEQVANAMRAIRNELIAADGEF